MTSSISVGSCYGWNGPVCSTCHKGYIGNHECSIVDLQRKIDDLQRVIDAIKLKQGTVGPDNWVKNCPCNPTRGGSGVCSCIMGGTKVIY